MHLSVHFLFDLICDLSFFILSECILNSLKRTKGEMNYIFALKIFLDLDSVKRSQVKAET